MGFDEVENTKWKVEVYEGRQIGIQKLSRRGGRLKSTVDEM